MITIKRKSALTGKETELELPITMEQLLDWEVNHMKIQDAMPNLTPDQREFLLTGILPEEWDELLGSEDD